jgi:hypothetical protein
LSFSKRSREYTAYSCVPNQYVDLGMHGDVCVSSLGQAAGASTQAKPCSRFQKLLPSYMADRHRVQVKRCRNHPARACIQLEERDSDRSAMQQRERERRGHKKPPRSFVSIHVPVKILHVGAGRTEMLHVCLWIARSPVVCLCNSTYNRD